MPIPGHGRNKLNAAYAFGGPPLLVRTVETVTGLRIDHYAEVGFGGFVGMTDAVGGVQLCPKRNINDHKSGLHVKKGCQEMDGATALAYVRARYFDPQGDLGRVKRQQEFLGAVFDEAVEPGDAAQPVPGPRPLGNAATTALTIDQGDGPWSLLRFALTMRAVAGGDGQPDHGAGVEHQLLHAGRLGSEVGHPAGARPVPPPARHLSRPAAGPGAAPAFQAVTTPPSSISSSGMTTSLSMCSIRSVESATLRAQK